MKLRLKDALGLGILGVVAVASNVEAEDGQAAPGTVLKGKAALGD